MKQFFLNLQNASLAESDLNAIGVSCLNFTLNTDTGTEKGVLVSDNDFERLIARFGLTSATPQQTDYEGVFYVECHKPGEVPPPQKSIKISRRSWDGNNYEKFASVTRNVFSPYVNDGYTIGISVPHNRTMNYQELKGADFHILIWSSYDTASQSVTPPEKLWGNRVSCRDTAFLPPGEGLIITAPDHPEYQVAELIDRRFLYIHHDVCHSGDSNELAIYRKILEAAMAFLALSETEYKELVKKMDGIRFFGFNKKTAEPYRKVAEEVLCPAVDKAIEVRRYRGERISNDRLPESSDKFQIHVFAVPGENLLHGSLPRELFGKRIPFAGEPIIYFSGTGLPIIDFKNGIIVGELTGNNLFIYFQVLFDREETDIRVPLEIWRHILEQAVWEMTASPVEKADKRKGFFGPLFVKTCLKRYEQEKANLDSLIAKNAKALAGLQAEICQTAREAQINELHCTALKDKYAEPAGTKAQADFETIAAMEKVGWFWVDQASRRLFVITDILYYEHPTTGQLHELGRFKIDISMESQIQSVNGKKTFGFRLFNLTRQVENQQAPHIPRDGIADLGIAALYLPEYLAKQEFAAIVDLAIQYIEAGPLNDKGLEMLGKWPLAKNEKR